MRTAPVLLFALLTGCGPAFTAALFPDDGGNEAATGPETGHPEGSPEAGGDVAAEAQPGPDSGSPEAGGHDAFPEATAETGPQDSGQAAETGAPVDAGCAPGAYECSTGAPAICVDNGTWVRAATDVCSAPCTDPSRFTVSYDNSTATDKTTGYVWSNNRQLLPLTLPQAQNYCASLGAFRLPTVVEAATLLVTAWGTCGNQIDQAAFETAVLALVVWTTDGVPASANEWAYSYNKALGLGEVSEGAQAAAVQALCIHM
jgi:hypothetical protein